MNILLGLTGSIATTLYEKIKKELDLIGPTRSIGTPQAYRCLNKTLQKMDEWDYYRETKQVLHIDLRNWADVFVIAPLSANTLGKISNGLCDNLLTNVARAWDFSKPMMVCPAMNTKMLNHPITNVQLSTLHSWGVHIINPQTKLLACNEHGDGAMCDIKDIIERVKRHELVLSNIA